MKKLIATIFFAISFSGQTTAQNNRFDSICCTPYEGRFEWRGKYLTELAKNEDSTAVYREIEEIIDYSTTTKNKELRLMADFIKAYYLYKNFPWQKERILRSLYTIKDKAKKNKNTDILSQVLSTLGLYYGNYIKDYESHFEVYDELVSLLENNKNDLKIEHLSLYVEVAHSYYRFKEFSQTITLLREIAHTPVNATNAYAVWQSNNTIGLCFRNLKQMDSSYYYFDRALTAATGDLIDSVRYAITVGNIGVNKYMENNYAEAKALLIQDIEISRARKELNSAASVMLIYADILIKEDKLLEAELMLNEAYGYIKKVFSSSLLNKYYPIKARWYQKMGNDQLSLLYYDSAFVSQRREDSTYSHLKLTLATQKLDVLKMQTDLSVSQSKIKERNLVIALICLLGVGIGIYLNSKRKYLSAIEKNRMLQLEQTQKELEHATSQLNVYVQNLSLQSLLIESLQEEINKEDKLEKIEELKEKTILTEDDWIKFKNAFEKVHVGFLDRLNKKLPKLTPSEQRFLTLVKLKLSFQEMSLMLGVSPKSLRITHYRLRKKLELEEIEELQELIDTI